MQRQGTNLCRFEGPEVFQDLGLHHWPENPPPHFPVTVRCPPAPLDCGNFPWPVPWLQEALSSAHSCSLPLPETTGGG